MLTQYFLFAFKVLAASIILQQIQDNLKPRVMQISVDVNPGVTFFALLVGARIAGLLGIFLALPIADSIVSLFEIEELKGYAFNGV